MRRAATARNQTNCLGSGNYAKEDKEGRKSFPMVPEEGSDDAFFYDLGVMTVDSVTHMTLLRTDSSYEAQKRYTPEIPSPAGPWKLWGLPGLIVEATESEGIFSFSLSSFTKMRPEDSKRGYASTLGFGKKIIAGKAEVIKLLHYYISDPIGYYNMQNPDAPAEPLDASGESIKGTFVNIEK